MKSKPRSSTRLVCSLCGIQNKSVTPCDAGYVCEVCAEKSRVGRDTTTKAVKTLQRSIRLKAEKERLQFKGEVIDDGMEYDIASAEVHAAEAFQHNSTITMVAGGEVLPQHDLQLIDTLAAPNATALDASANRLALITNLGTDIAAMALDASETIGASNSFEKMLAHQMAVCHDGAMRFAAKSSLEQDPVHMIRFMNAATRSMDMFQKGLLAFKSIRSNGEQRIMVQHVDVREGGQAVIGQLAPGRRGAK